MPSRALSLPGWPRRLAACLCILGLSLTSVFAAPVAPSNLRGYVYAGSGAVLVWNDNSTDETHFEVQFTDNGTPFPHAWTSAEALATTAGTGTAAVDLGAFPLTAGHTYTFKMRAYTGSNANSSAYSNTITMHMTDFNIPAMVAATPNSETEALVTYVDDSIGEAGYFIDYRELPSGTFATASLNPNTAGVLFPGLPGISYEFRMRAFKGTAAVPTQQSLNSATISVAMPFYPPTGLTATQQSNGNINLAWADNTTQDGGYAIYVKKATDSTYALWDYTAPSATSYAVSGLAPNTAYNFQVAAAYARSQSNIVESARSNTANASTAATMLAPTLVSVTATNETSVTLNLTDNTTNNTGYEIEYRLKDTGSFVAFGDAGDGPTITATDFVDPGTAYDFRLRAYYLDGTTRIYSAYSNTVSATTPYAVPTGLAASNATDGSINLSWTNNTLNQSGVAIYIKLAGSSSFSLYGYVGAQTTSTYQVNGLAPGTAYDFQVAASYVRTSPGAQANVSSAPSNTASISTKDAFTSRTYQPITLNQSFSYQAVVSTASSRSSWNITGLPTGLTFNSSTGIVSGTPTVSGVFACPMTATFADGWTTNSTLTLRIIRAPGSPITGTTITTQTIANGGNTSVSLTDKFSDPDSESAVRIVTNLGTMDFILYNTATPQTVTNFLNYVNGSTSATNYNGAVFHRSIPGFIVQGGAFKVQSAPNNFTSITTAASPTNEPGISNLRGTVAMAKLGSDPNSATDQFFVNLADNSSNLDNQNGGFTAFARVAGNGMAVADAMAALPTVNSSVNVDGSATTQLTDWPLTSSSASMDTSKVVTITSAAPVAVLSYSVTGNTNPTAVSASISGTNVQINGLAGGQSDVTVTATDLDGNTVTQTFTVNVNQGPAFTSGEPTSPAVKNAAYNFVCTASGFPAPTFSVTAGALPAGLTLATDGTISGTPTATGTFTGTITATNTVTTATQNFSITVNEVPAFTNGPPTSTGLKGTAYSFTYTASGVPAPTFSVTAGALPGGLTLASNGAITGTPNTAGTFTGTVTATNSAGTATQNFSITINESPAFTGSAPTGVAVVGSAYNFTCTGSGSPAPTFSVTAGALPPGLTLAPGGAISGTPNAGGTFTGTITAANVAGSATQNFSITVTVTLNNWAASKGLSGGDALPGADPDHDGRTNLQEFAFLSEPNAADGGTVPSYALATPGGIGYGEITFPVRKFAPTLTYTVEVSDSLTSGTWSPLWTTADGFGASVVRSTVDQTDRTVLTVRDTQASPPAVRRFLRVTVMAP